MFPPRISKLMAPRNASSPPSSTSILIGNCEVIVQAKNFTSKSNQNSLQISLSRKDKVTISVVDGKCNSRDNEPDECGDHHFVLINPKDKDSDGETKALIQEVLDLYKKELPAMNYAANTGKETQFLQKCVSNGKYCSLLLKCKGFEHHGEVIAAMSYQIVPSDTQCAEIPLAAVSPIHQNKGIGHSLYMELRRRLQSVGIRTIFCWGDKESEGFWIKQGFGVIGEVSTKGRARRLPIKADIRKALCFPGGSSLMVSHIEKDSIGQLRVQSDGPLPLRRCSSSAVVLKEQSGSGVNQELSRAEDPQLKILVTDSFFMDGLSRSMDCSSMGNTSGLIGSKGNTDVKQCSCSEVGTNKRIWEASYSSLNSKKIRGGHLLDCQLSLGDSVFRNGDATSKVPLTSCHLEKSNAERANYILSEDHGVPAVCEKEKCFRIILMNIADDNKKSTLTKIIGDLGGVVTSDGGMSTHVITGKVRKTLNFCRALCSGSWILSPSWLKESFRAGRFVDEMPFILKDEDYESKYKKELKNAILRARASPNALLRGYDICVAAHVPPPISNLSAIIKSAGGSVIHGLENMNEASRTIFIAYEEDVEEALAAVKKGIRTFGSDWFMNCIMRQELDLEAPQFAESL